MDFERSLITIIVPVFKVELYLEQCVLSIINQTYKNIEIILVDDGSPDKCPEMCDRLSLCDSRIKVIHKQNGGLSSARNAGLKAAKGDYIGFVDSDDWITPDMYETLISHFTNQNIGVVGCAYYDYLEGEQCVAQGYSSDLLLGGIELVDNFLRENIMNNVWCKLFKRECIEDLYFVEGLLAEDLPFTFNAFLNCKKRDKLFYYTPTPLYYYRQNSASIMHSQLEKVQEHVLLQLKNILESIDQHEIHSLVQPRYYSELVYYLCAMEVDDHRFAGWQSDLKKLEISKCKHIGFRHKIMCLILIYFPYIWKLQVIRDFCCKRGKKLPIFIE